MGRLYSDHLNNCLYASHLEGKVIFSSPEIVWRTQPQTLVRPLFSSVHLQYMWKYWHDWFSNLVCSCFDQLEQRRGCFRMDTPKANFYVESTILAAGAVLKRTSRSHKSGANLEISAAFVVEDQPCKKES